VRSGLIISILLHAALLAWALFTIQSQRELRMPEPEPLAVELVSASDLTKLRQGVRTAKLTQAEPKESPKTDLAKKEAPKPTPVAAAPPPPAPEPPAPKPEPKPEPKNDPIADKIAAAPPEPPLPVPEQQKLEQVLKEQERLAEEERKAEEQRRLEEESRKEAELKKKLEEEKRRKEAELKRKREEERKRREAEAKKKFDAEKIAALLNKIPEKGAPRPSMTLDEQARRLEKGPVLGAPEGRDQEISASEIAVLAQIIRSCVQTKWNVLGGGEGAQTTVVKLRLRFNPDGTLSAAPQIMNPQSTPFFQAVSDSAVRAVQQCEPFNLPPAKYDIWKDIVLNFDPREMF
jgi:colicin import membrane protein